jgi:hypothetical protein
MDAVEAIQKRNARVEVDKAWETSKTRHLCIAALTYVIAFFYMWSLGDDGAALYALIPTGGYLLSTLSLSFLKDLWVHKLYQTGSHVKLD